MRIPNVWQAAMNLGGVGLRRLRRHGRSVAQVCQRAGRKARRSAETFREAPALVRTRMRRGRAAIERSGNRISRFNDHVVRPCRTERRVKSRLRSAASGNGPIIVGPWTSEVGYEVLYWLPFLRWALDRYDVDPKRVVAVSRGGTSEWYEGIAAGYVDVFDLVDPDAFAAEAAARREQGDQKQLAPSAFDLRLVAQACARLGARDAALWHPGLMYQLFRPFWYGDRSRQYLFRHMDFRYRGIAAAAGNPALPSDYVAVKFYTGPALPLSEGNSALIRALVARIATKTPVVVLDTAWSTDEHRDYTFDGLPGVTTLRPSLNPRTNLGVQSRVIAGARRFVGTCGGLAWLAPFLGVDTLAVYEDDRYLTAHLYAAGYAYRRNAAGRFSTLNIKALRGVTRPQVHIS